MLWYYSIFSPTRACALSLQVLFCIHWLGPYLRHRYYFSWSKEGFFQSSLAGFYVFSKLFVLFGRCTKFLHCRFPSHTHLFIFQPITSPCKKFRSTGESTEVNLGSSLLRQVHLAKGKPLIWNVVYIFFAIDVWNFDVEWIDKLLRHTRNENIQNHQYNY